MIHFALFAQLVGVPIAGDSVYSSRAVRELVTEAAARNAQMSALLPAYRASAESEFTWIIEDTAGRPQSMIAQQHYSNVRWSSGVFDVHVLSERPAIDIPQVQPLTGPGWLIPALYGDGFAFVYPVLSHAEHREPLAIDTMRIPHPFGTHRESRYRFSGGERQATLHVGRRDIPIVRIHVVPVFVPGEWGAAFEGDVYIEANQLDIVRIHGRVLVIDKDRTRSRRPAVTLGTTIASYVDVTNEEIDGRFWLPLSERVEFQMTTPLLPGTRSVMRLSATLADHAIENAIVTADSATTTNPRARVAFAPWDSLRLKRDWGTRLGASSTSARSSDFDDLAPDAWRPDGPPRLSLRPSSMSKLVRVNPVEGWFTGLEGTLAFRDAVPGLTARAFGGWAWSEQVVRGGGRLEWTRGGSGLAVGVERSLESTNDFESSISMGDPLLAAVFGLTPQRDWIDRRTATVSAFTLRGLPGKAIGSVQFGVARDGSEATRLARMPFASKSESLPPNRAARPGRYRRASADLQLNPDVGLRTPVSGFGSSLHYEIAAGDLNWQRATIGLVRRDRFDDVWFLERVDAGVVAGSRMPPQALFELGGPQDLFAYRYKEFAGDRAAIGSVGASYLFPATRGWRIPVWWIPPIAPGVSAGAQFGYSRLSSAASAAVLELDPSVPPIPLSIATNGVRGSAGAGFTLLSGLVHFGGAHAFDPGAKWRWAIGVSTRY